MSELIDIAFIAAKIAAIKDEKERMIVGRASLVYNVMQVMRFRSMIVELSQLCNCIVFRAQLCGCYTQEDLNLALDCQKQIVECNNQIVKHGTMSVLDGISLLIDGLTKLNRK
mgnify:CR=1 FL=1|jgi:hypothetical protein